MKMPNTHGKPRRHYTRTLFLITALVAMVTVATLSTHGVSAADSTDNIVETVFFGNLKDDGEGCGVTTVLGLVVEILTIGVGILGVIGIIIVGIQYLTAGGSEEKTKKAKRRIGEIILGLIIYAILFAVAQWLLPGGMLNSDKRCTVISDEELANLKAQEATKKQQQNSSSNSNNSSSSSSSKTPTNSNGKTISWSEKIAQTAEDLSWPIGTHSSKYHHEYNSPTGFSSWSDLYQGKPNKAFMEAYDKVRPDHQFYNYSQIGADCGVFVTTVLRVSGHDKKMRYGTAESWYESHNWKKVDKPKRGDVCIWHNSAGGGFHTRIYLGDGKVAEANYDGQNFGHITKGGCSGSNWTVYRATNKK